MKILHIITSLRTGGAERLVAELALRHAGKRILDSALNDKNAGNQVEVLLFDGTPTPLVEALEMNGVPVHSLGKGPRAMYNPFLLPRLVRFLRKHPSDIVHAHNSPCQILTALAPARSRITTEHGTLNRRRNWLWFKPIDRWMYGRYKKIACVGEETRKTLSDWLNRPELDLRMTVIPNGIDLDGITSATPAEDLFKQEGYKVLMVSAFRPEKDQQTLIRAVSKLPDDYLLYLAGIAETPESQRIMNDCRAQATAMGIDDRVHFLGLRADVPALLAAADVIVLSSRHEGMSLSVLEGMASGKPMIASDVEGMRELVKDAGLLFPPGDAETLAALIRDICENPEKAREIGQRCKVKVRQYDIAETARRYKNLYLEVSGV